MARKDNTNQLSVRLDAVHWLLTEMLNTLLGWITEGSAKRFATEHGPESDSVEQDFASLISPLADLGERLAWLDNPHLEALRPLEGADESEGFRLDNPVETFTEFPDTKNRFLNTLLLVTSMLNQTHSLTEKLMMGCEQGRFKDESQYRRTDLNTACIGLLVDSIHLLEQFWSLKPFMLPGVDVDVPSAIKDYLMNRMDIRDDEVALLRASLPEEEIVGATVAAASDEEDARRFFASWYGHQA